MGQRCRDFSGVFVSRLGRFGVVNVDGAKADDDVKNATEVTAATEAAICRDRRRDTVSESWLVSHRPFNAVRTADKGASNKIDNSLQAYGDG